MNFDFHYQACYLAQNNRSQPVRILQLQSSAVAGIFCREYKDAVKRDSGGRAVVVVFLKIPQAQCLRECHSSYVTPIPC